MRYTAKSPSNIAILKYWGKKNEKFRWPSNDSISITLSNSYTTTSVEVSDSYNIFFNGYKLNLNNSIRILNFIKIISDKFQFNKKINIYTKNNFPTSCGIASSASGFSALTIAYMSLIFKVKSFNDLLNYIDINQLAMISRLGSGSSVRSFMGGVVLWKMGKSYKDQSIEQIFRPDHMQIIDIIIIISDHQKKISSSKAHSIVHSSPFFETRLSGLEEKRDRMIYYLRNKNFKNLGHMIEYEALEIHYTAMTSDEKINYLTAKSFDWICFIRNLRYKKNIDVFFTIDAGPNIHLLCLNEYKDIVIKEIRKKDPNIGIIIDMIGNGPSLNVT